MVATTRWPFSEIAVYEIAPDEVLIFEADPPNARYWNVHLGDILNQTRDYVHHKSSINDRQAVPDTDGKISRGSLTRRSGRSQLA